jgi:hypothetical protein
MYKYGNRQFASSPQHATMARTRNRGKGSQKASNTDGSDELGATSSFVTPDGVRISEIPMRSPEYGQKPTGRTLLDIIDEKRPRDADGNPIGVSREGDEEDEEEVFGHGMNTFFFAVPLTILLFWLDVLVHMQYRQEMEWRLILMRCLKAFPGKPVSGTDTWESTD